MESDREVDIGAILVFNHLVVCYISYENVFSLAGQAFCAEANVKLSILLKNSTFSNTILINSEKFT